MKERVELRARRRDWKETFGRGRGNPNICIICPLDRSKLRRRSPMRTAKKRKSILERKNERTKGKGELRVPGHERDIRVLGLSKYKCEIDKT